jgi:thiamine-phosphate pyrophosphorylase
MSVLPPPLVALTPGAPAARVGLARAVGRAVAAGLRGVVLREPGLEDGAFLALARDLAGVLAPVDGWLCLHDRVHLVRAAGARAAHLGFRSLRPAAARAVLGAQHGLGLSTHAADDPDGWDALDYRFFGPLHATPSKSGLLAPVGLDGLRAACAAAPPVWAIGGVTPGDAAAALAAGARGICALRGVLGAPDPGAAAAAYLDALAAGGAACG